MAGKVVGLDIGTHAVRAAEVSFGRGLPTLERFGQVALPFGAVSGGEVVDAAAVSSALRRLWKEAGLSSKKVVVGVANQRVVARTAELPAMPDAELRSALKYQVQELIPIPVDDAVLDHQVIERVTGDDGRETLRLLVVAAHKDMLRSLLAALEGAGLAAKRIDYIPFALVRASTWTASTSATRRAGRSPSHRRRRRRGHQRGRARARRPPLRADLEHGWQRPRRHAHRRARDRPGDGGGPHPPGGPPLVGPDRGQGR
jgi:type IV pilus assembly protein PilM